MNLVEPGIVPYEEAVALQTEWHSRVLAGEGDVVIALQHPPVVTLGKSAGEQNIVDRTSYEESKVQVIRSERGGDVTVHMPGQLVVYPIIHLKRRGIGVKDYVCRLEQVIIDFLADVGVAAARDKINPGVWVHQNKICALGIRVKDRVSMHGLALNVNNDLSLFQSVVPCGIQGRGVTSLERELGEAQDFTSVSSQFIELFQSRFKT